MIENGLTLQVFKTLWGHEGDLDLAIEKCVAFGFDGIEGQAPDTNRARHDFRQKLDENGLSFIAEVCTAGSYVPRRDATVEEHRQSFAQQAEAALECRPLFVSSIAGCDAWNVAQSVEFFGAAHEFAGSCGTTASFETHRGRSFFNPWTTRDVLQQLPALRITCDFSHWCVVCERLIDSEPDVLQLCAERAHHIHARVGYDQGPQVPDPRAIEYSNALQSHERWWRMIWREQRQSGREGTTMTPEFGPDGYMQTLPHTQMPVGDVNEINRWMMGRQRQQFEMFQTQSKSS